MSEDDRIDNLEQSEIQPGIKKKSFYSRFMIIGGIVCIVLNILARIPAVCDFYTDHFFWIASATYGRLCGLAHFSVGEPAIVLAILFAVVTLVSAVLLIFLRRKLAYRRYAIRIIKSFFAFLLLVAYLMTFNCSLPYGCSRIHINDRQREDYDFHDLLALYNYLAENCNELCDKQVRDSNGDAVYSAVYGQDVSRELVEELRKTMHGISDEFPRLSGYFPWPKGLIGSVFMYNTGTIGVYFPFTMEANYSTYLAQVHFPATVCHEYSHLKGYMFEDEANFVSFVACMKSDNDFVRYSGFLNAVDYVEMDVMNAVAGNPEYEEILQEKAVLLSERVYADYPTYTEKSRAEAKEATEQFEEKTGVSSETINDMGESFTESYADYYNVKLNYNEVTYRLLQYYDGKL